MSIKEHELKYIFEFNMEDKNIVVAENKKNNTQIQYGQRALEIKEKISTYENRIEKLTGKGDIVAGVLTVIVIILTIAAVADSTSTSARIASIIGAPLIFGGIAYGLYFLYGVIAALMTSAYTKSIESLNVEMSNLMDKHFEKEQENVDALLDEFLSKPTNDEQSGGNL